MTQEGAVLGTARIGRASTKRPITVLHVDDNATLADLAATYLERSHEDISVVTATTAQDGLDELDENYVDCVVSDHDMPGMNGLEFLRAVREEHSDIPFVLFTGKGSEEIASDAISAGVTEYLQKGTGTDQYAVLANRIERAVEEYRAKDALEESERMFSTLVSNLPGMAYRSRNEPDWPMEFVSEGCRELTGYDPVDLVDGDVVWGEDVLHPGERERAWETVQTALDARAPFEITYRIVTAEGETKRVWEQGQGVFGDDRLVALEGIIMDVESSVSRLLDSDGEWVRRTVVTDRIDEPVVAVDTDRTITYCNDAAADLLGRERDAVEGSDLCGVTPEAVRPKLAAQYDRALESDEPVRFDLDYTPDDRRFDVTMYPGEAGVSVYARDVTERYEQKMQLEQYRTLVENVGDPMYAADEEGRFTFINDAVTDLLGYRPEELIGEKLETIIDEDAFRKSKDHIRRLVSDDDRSYVTFETTLVTSDGRRVPAENHAALLGDDSSFEGTVGVVREITERKQREKRLEEFTSVVSHDLQSPLNVVSGRAELALETGDMEHVEAIAGATERMEQLVEDLLTLARKGQTVGEVTATPLSAVVEAAWSEVRTPGTELLVDSDVAVEADPDRLRELLVNLFRNSVEHGSTDGDGVTVTVGTLPDASGFYVADDGTGIPPDERETVFEHGYTTSESGTGLGLAIVERIAEAHGWSVSVTESAAGGARFEVVTG